MFFYTSFLRPPPHVSEATSPISITPQIANDLRTSYLDDATDMFYVWSPSLHDCATSIITTTARKMTTWRESSMYKSLMVTLPSNSGAGQDWRLALSTDTNFVINLAAKPFGTRPLPVISMPVNLEERGRGSRSSTKQEQIERLYAIPGVENQRILFCIREQTSFDLDKKIWDSGLGLSSWLTNCLLSEPPDNPLIRDLKTLIATRKSHDGLQVLELGAGTGIVSICLSILLEKMHVAQNSHVLATDLSSAIDLIKHNITSNKSAYHSLSLEALTLDWDESLPSSAQGPIDLIIMADVTYNTSSFPALVRTLNTLINSSQASTESRTPAILLAYKQRDVAERELWPMLHDIGIHPSLIDSVKGAGAEAVEVWLWNGGSAAKT